MWVRSNRVRQKLPVRAASFRHVLPRVVGLPHRCVLCVRSHPIRLQRAVAVTGLLAYLSPGPLWSVGSSIVPCPGFPCGASGAVYHLPRFSTYRNVEGFPRSSTPLFLPATAGGRRRICPSAPLRRGAGCLRERSNPRRPLLAFSKLYQHFRVRGHPYGLQDTLSTLRPSCSPGSCPRLRHGRKTRYGWVTHPSPTGTCTLQETPSLSWSDNARRQAQREAGAEHSEA